MNLMKEGPPVSMIIICAERDRLFLLLEKRIGILEHEHGVLLRRSVDASVFNVREAKNVLWNNW